MPQLLTTIFWDNPELDVQAIAWIKKSQEYEHAYQEYKQQLNRFSKLLTPQQFTCFSDYEDAANQCNIPLTKGYYFFGLGLKREIAEAILFNDQAL